jgi:hypothetical protein
MKKCKCKITLCILIVTIILFSGCTEKISDTATNISQKTKSVVDDGIDFIVDNLLKEDIKIIQGVSALPTFEQETIDTYQAYQNFADVVNALFKFLNREGGYNFQILKGTQEEYEKISKFVTEYGPLVNNYNSIVYASKNYNHNDPESLKEYYKALGTFGLEFAIIYTTVWYSPTYKAVGMVYRWSGLNRLAFKCPTLISFILSQAHWGLRGILVDKSSGAANFFIDELGKLDFN